MEKLETKRGWNTGMGGWGKRKKRSTKDSTIEDEANNTTGQRITRNGRKYILLTPAQIRCTVVLHTVAKLNFSSKKLLSMQHNFVS